MNYPVFSFPHLSADAAKSNCSSVGPSMEMNISSPSVLVFNLLRGHLLILFKAENPRSQSAEELTPL